MSTETHGERPGAPRGGCQAVLLRGVMKVMRALALRLERTNGASDYQILPASQVEAILKAYSALFQANRGFALPANRRRLELLAHQQGTPVPEALYILEAITRTAGQPGDVCEFGVAQGFTSALIANEIMSETRSLHLFDSFEGLSRPGAKDTLKDDVQGLGSMEAYEGHMAYREVEVRRRLAAIGFPAGRTAVHKGFIAAVLARNEGLPKRVSCAYVDFDFYDPIRDALAFLDSVTEAGAVVVVDDYDFFSTGAKTAVDEFVSAHRAWEMEVPDKLFGYFAILTRKAAN